ncbi:hypothetical protein [Trichococcus patagoniensis]|nr:hypothetical protein [Trichococcus patagoniensis]
MVCIIYFVYNPELYGNLADWVGIIATVLTIFLTLRHYSNDNRIDFRIMCYSKNVSEKENGTTSIKGERELVVCGVNFSKSPQLFRFEGFEKKESVFDLIGRMYSGEKKFVLPLDFEIIRHEVVDYELVNQNEKSKDIFLSENYVNRYLKINNIDIHEGFFVVYMHISGKRFKNFIKAM